MIRRSLLGLGILFVLMGAMVCFAQKNDRGTANQSGDAALNIPEGMSIQEASRANLEMRKNVTWMVAGLAELEKSKVKALHLTKEQKLKIRPIFQELITQKIISLKIPASAGNYGLKRNRLGASEERTGNRQKMAQGLEKQALLGNKSADLVDGILSKAQVSFIDNLDFQAENYGYQAARGNGQSGRSLGNGTSSPDPKGVGVARKAMQEGRERLIKLNIEVWELLK